MAEPGTSVICKWADGSERECFGSSSALSCVDCTGWPELPVRPLAARRFGRDHREAAEEGQRQGQHGARPVRVLRTLCRLCVDCVVRGCGASCAADASLISTCRSLCAHCAQTTVASMSGSPTTASTCPPRGWVLHPMVVLVHPLTSWRWSWRCVAAGMALPHPLSDSCF